MQVSDLIRRHDSKSVTMIDIADPIVPFDGRTSRSICDAVDERLRQKLQPHSLLAAPYLLQLLEEFRRQEEASAGTTRPR